MSSDPLFVVIVIAMVAVVIILLVGIGGFAKGGAFNKKYGNKMMQARIAAQFVAIVLILIYVYLRSTGSGE